MSPRQPDEITPDLLLQAYSRGIFPMAESRNDDRIFWVSPERRGLLPIREFHVSRSLARRLRRGDYAATLDRDFAGVLDGCADRDETWINPRIRDLYLDLHQRGIAHSIEIWRDGRLAGGSYGVALGATYFGESMFSRTTDASKLALAHLTDHLERQGFLLFDTQFLTAHLASLGGYEIPREEFLARLRRALATPTEFGASVPLASGAEVARARRARVNDAPAP